MYTKDQFIDTVLVCSGAVTVEIMGRCTDTLTIQTGLASPFEVVVFAHYGVGDVVVSRLIFGEKKDEKKSAKKQAKGTK